ncbi:origin recognition complex, subunit 4 [Linderina pennispora]|uniref:Origin recognition complex subunit 4 n=1 Tax=Linderina pennispora TaxID=61395 RepID=A0A1Y1W1R5_9FUNG|nr:origin recognition complex, subunit 4 [Linderina pennispora]ORX67489.1 origin recognition complex, subunit 4 [Linderina pennispora]
MPSSQRPGSCMIDASSIQHARRLVLDRLHGRTQLPELIGLETPLDLVHSLLDRTISSQEGNTALLIGPRGSGKSAIVERVLNMLAEKHTDRADSRRYHIVRLNGFVHTNDRIALRDIATQLLIEQDLGDVLVGSFADAFTYILNLLRSSGADGEMPPVIFILEEFDLLAQHPKQSLLYTLFDIAQSQQTPIAVLGVSARIDVIDLLEKRVKSRFSHRQIYVQNTANLEDFEGIARTALRINCADEKLSAAFSNEFNHQVDNVLADEQVSAYISDVFDFGKDVRQLLRTFVLAVSHLSIRSPFIVVSDVLAAIARERSSAKMLVLSNISLLELCLIIAMRSLVKGGNTKYNFEMIYNEYKSFMSRHITAATSGGSMKIYKKSVALKAFETLVGLEIVRPATITISSASNSRNDLLAGSVQGTRAPKEYRMVQLMLEPGQVSDLVGERAGVPVVIRRWSQQ